MVSYYLGLKEWGRTGCFEVIMSLKGLKIPFKPTDWKELGRQMVYSINLYKQVNLTILWITILFKKRTSFHWDQTLIRLNQHTWHMSSFSRRITSFHGPRRGFCRSTVVQLRRGFCDGRWKMEDVEDLEWDFTGFHHISGWCISCSTYKISRTKSPNMSRNHLRMHQDWITLNIYILPAPPHGTFALNLEILLK